MQRKPFKITITEVKAIVVDFSDHIMQDDGVACAVAEMTHSSCVLSDASQKD